jgi:predicted exporter
MAKRLPIFIWLCTIALAAIAVVRANYVADMSAFLPANPTSNQSILIEQLTHGSLSRTILIGIEGAPSETLAQASQALSTAMQSSQHFSIVQNGNPEGTRKDQAFIFNNRYLLSPTTIEHFSEQGLHKAISESIDLLGSPLGLMVKKIFPQDPTGELLSVINNLGFTNQIESAHGVWLVNNGQRALLLAQTNATGTDTDQQEAAVHFIRTQFAHIQKSIGSALSLKMTGSPVFSINARETIHSQVLVFSSLGLAAISCLFLWVFRSVKTFALGTLPILSGILCGITAVSLCFSSVHAITIGFGSTLIGEAVDYSIYYFSQAQKQNDEWKQRFWPTIRLGTLTSIVGFLALLTTDFPGLAQLSAFTIAGLSAAVLVTRYVLPALHNPNLNDCTLNAIGNTVIRLLPAVSKLRYIGYVFALLMIVPFLSGTVKWGNQVSDLSPISKADKALDIELRSNLSAGGARHIIVMKAASADAALEASERITSLISPLQEQNLITGFDVPSKLLPSIATQTLRKNAIPTPNLLNKRLEEAIKDLPVKRKTLEPFFTDSESVHSAPLINQDNFSGTSLNEVIKSLLYPVGEQWVAIGIIKDSPETPVNPQSIKDILDQVPQLDAQYIDLLNESNQMYEQYVSGTLSSCLFGVFGIFILLSAARRSIPAAIRIMAPLVISSVVVAGVLGLAGVNLTLLHAVGFLLIFAIGSNYALLVQNNQGEVDPISIASLIVACLATMFGFGVLAFTEVPVLKAIGQTVGPGASLSLFFALSMATNKPRNKSDAIR